MGNYGNKHYGLTGETVRVRLREGSTGTSYPWGDKEVPVQITGEHTSFLCGTVLPHRNPEARNNSLPYPITISKHDIFLGEIVINGGTVR